MKFFIASLALIAVAAAQQYNQRPIAIVRQSLDQSPDGSYNFAFDTDDGTHRDEQGQLRALRTQNTQEGPAVVVQGSYSYTDSNGTPVQVTYIADENGFQPQGSHIPQIPEYIQRSLEYNAAHPEEDESQQDQYHAQKN